MFIPPNIHLPAKSPYPRPLFFFKKNLVEIKKLFRSPRGFPLRSLGNPAAGSRSGDPAETNLSSYKRYHNLFRKSFPAFP
jgi:hypothetical protein